MGITLTAEEEKDLAQQCRRDPRVVLAFFDLFAQLQRAEVDVHAAYRLALDHQQEVFREVFEEKATLYVKLARRNYASRLRNLKRLRAGTGFRTRSGVMVRSKIEKIIADFLWDHGIRFEYEPIVELGRFCVIPDFHLTDFGVLLEHFGLDSQQYRESAAAKLDRYREHGLRGIFTCSSDEPDIEAVLTKRLAEAGILLAAQPDSPMKSLAVASG